MLHIGILNNNKQTEEKKKKLQTKYTFIHTHEHTTNCVFMAAFYSQRTKFA